MATGFPPVISAITVQNVNLTFTPGSATFFSGAQYARAVTLTMNLNAVAGGQIVNLSAVTPASQRFQHRLPSQPALLQ